MTNPADIARALSGKSFFRGFLDDREAALLKELEEVRLAKMALSATGPATSRPAIKDAVYQGLVACPQGMTWRDISEMLFTKHGMRIDRTSLSPQLSRLKQRGLIENRGGHWLAVRDYLLHRPTIDASTDRNQAKVVRCGKGIE